MHALTAAAALYVPLSGSAAEVRPSKCEERFRPYLEGPPDWGGPGPLPVLRLPRLEHTCVSCFPACVGTSCLIRADVTYPKGGLALGLSPPYPLAIFSSGFLVSSDSYRSYADTLASWGYTCLLYDRQETVADFLDDDACVAVIRDLITWCSKDPLLRRVADTRRVYLVGHSRGGKLSALAAASDARVAAVCLIDAVNNTVYAPLAPGFPSAVDALRQLPHEERALPVAVVGSGRGGDCAPQEANYTRFYEANRGPSWEVNIRDAGHFSFLDARSPLQRAVCPEGGVSEDAARRVSQAVMVAWAETMVRHRGLDVASRGLPWYPGACQQQHQQRLQHSSGLQLQAALPAGPGAVPALPTWGTPLPQFEDAVGTAGAARPWRAVGSADAAEERSAEPSAGRKRVSSPEPDDDPSACPRRVDASLQQGLSRMLHRVSYDAHLTELDSRYKNFT